MHAADVQKAREADKLTVGTVQREIRVGMSGAQVAEVLGSPNVVRRRTRTDGGFLGLTSGSHGERLLAKSVL